MKFDDNMAMKPIEIFLADDHGMMNAGLTALLQQEPDMEVCGIFTSAQQLLDRMQFDTPDLVISDISMPDMNGLELAKIIREKHPKVRIILLTMHASAAWVKQAKETGVQGYLLKESGLQEMRDAIHTVMNGEKYISSKAAVNLLKEEQEGTRITPRETEILQMLARGLHAIERRRRNAFCQRLLPHLAKIRTKSSLMRYIGAFAGWRCKFLCGAGGPKHARTGAD